MKFKQVILGLTLSLALISTATHADIILHSSKTNANVCDHLPGTWSGQGVVSAKVLGIKIVCQYQGSGSVKPKSTPYAYDFDVNLKLVSGPCPGSRTVSIVGTCDPLAGVLVLNSADAHLSGNISPDGSSASLTGKVNMSVMGHTITADVERMNLQKQ